MHPALQELLDALTSLAMSIESGGNDSPLVSMHGWNCPSVSVRQLAQTPKLIAQKLEFAKIGDLTQQQEQIATEFRNSVHLLVANTLPQLFSSNAATAAPAIAVTLNCISEWIDQLVGWQTLPATALPAQLIRRVHKAQRDLDSLAPDLGEIESRVASIRDAHEYAEALPETLQDLRAARREMGNLSANASEVLGVIKANESKVQELTERVKHSAENADSLAKQCALSYQITTSTGLAAAFDHRAAELNRSQKWWVFYLVVALTVGMSIGAWRLSQIGQLLSSDKAIDPSRLWVQVLLSALSIGGPVWFAWMATKQIGQRFRLGEDYAYKASVAKAYEGYRQQAALIDPKLEHALFASALLRLDEAPLRFVEAESHSSPLQELANSPVVKDLANKVTSIAERIIPGKAVEKADL